MCERFLSWTIDIIVITIAVLSPIHGKQCCFFTFGRVIHFPVRNRKRTIVRLSNMIPFTKMHGESAATPQGWQMLQNVKEDVASRWRPYTDNRCLGDDGWKIKNASSRVRRTRVSILASCLGGCVTLSRSYGLSAPAFPYLYNVGNRSELAGWASPGTQVLSSQKW